MWSSYLSSDGSSGRVKKRPKQNGSVGRWLSAECVADAGRQAGPGVARSGRPRRRPLRTVVSANPHPSACLQVRRAAPWPRQPGGAAAPGPLGTDMADRFARQQRPLPRQVPSCRPALFLLPSVPTRDPPRPPCAMPQRWHAVVPDLQSVHWQPQGGTMHRQVAAPAQPDPEPSSVQAPGDRLVSY